MLDGDIIVNMLLAAGHPEARIYADRSAIMMECQRYYLSNCADDLRQSVCPGVTELLRELKNREAVLGLVTGNLSQIGWKKMELAGLRKYFSFGAFAEDASTRTELAKVAAKQAAEADLAEPDSRISLVGDHPNDIDAAKANGFQAIGVATGLSTLEELEATNPDAAVRTLYEIEVSRLLK
jgi:phosphoglycolate phosphatase-like HAD superfamily hydrolase